MDILIIEDREEDLNWVKELFNFIREKVAIDSASCFEEAKKKTDIKHYDLILLDLGLPGTHGIETVEKFKKLRADSYRNHNTPYIILTGTEDYGVGKKALKMGAKDFLIKGDFDAHELEHTINYATYSRHMPKRRSLYYLVKRA